MTDETKPEPVVTQEYLEGIREAYDVGLTNLSVIGDTLHFDVQIPVVTPYVEVTFEITDPNYLPWDGFPLGEPEG